MENKYIRELKKLILSELENENMQVFLFGSRARNDNHYTSDVDIAIVPEKNSNTGKISSLKEKIENSNIPYKVEIVNVAEVSDDFKNEIMKDAIEWKD